MAPCTYEPVIRIGSIERASEREREGWDGMRVERVRKKEEGERESERARARGVTSRHNRPVPCPVLRCALRYSQRVVRSITTIKRSKCVFEPNLHWIGGSGVGGIGCRYFARFVHVHHHLYRNLLKLKAKQEERVSIKVPPREQILLCACARRRRRINTRQSLCGETASRRLRSKLGVYKVKVAAI